MPRKPLFFDAEAFLSDVNKRFEEEEFLQDFKNFLSYVVNNKIKLTPKCRWIPMKHVYAINDLLKNPLQLDDRIRDKIYKTREECYARRIYFMDLLAEASEYIASNKRDVLIPGIEYKKFLNMDGFSKKRWLILTWWFGMDWDNWMPEGDFGEMLQKKKLDIIPYIKEIINIRHRVDFKKFAKSLIVDLSLKWEAPSQSYARSSMEGGIEYCILEPLTWFDIIKLDYQKEDEFGIKKIKGFYIKPFGTIFLNHLVEVGEKIKEDMLKKSQVQNN